MVKKSLKDRLQNVKKRFKSDNLGPDRGTMDQEEARIERAKMEARREAKREQVRMRVDEARERERERVLGDDSGGVLSSIADALEPPPESRESFDGGFGGGGGYEPLDAEQFGVGGSGFGGGMPEDPMADEFEYSGGDGFEPLDPDDFGFGDSYSGEMFGGERR